MCMRIGGKSRLTLSGTLLLDPTALVFADHKTACGARKLQGALFLKGLVPREAQCKNFLLGLPLHLSFERHQEPLELIDPQIHWKLKTWLLQRTVHGVVC